jgi:hypothetical protein
MSQPNHQPRPPSRAEPTTAPSCGLSDFTLDELRRIPILTSGTRLQSGAVYLDLGDPARRPFTARGDETVAARSWVVHKADVPLELWTRLIEKRAGR